jgi:peptide/nickel transport system substrate-binding protein
MARTRYTILIFLIFTSLVLPACAPQETQVPTVPPVSTRTPAPLSTPTPASRSLNICLGDEPNSLYPYGELNSAARSVLSAIYDGPMDIVEYGYQPVILEKLPSLENGDAQIAAVTVKAGDQIVDSSGDIVTLASGVKFRPSACRGDNCVVTYDGSSALQMDQMIVTFNLREGLLWSDGEPLTADDSVYSFTLASDNATPVSKFLIDRTQTYEAADEQTVQWWGVPGFIDPSYYTNFWMPLPKHAWEEISAAELLKAEVSSQLPLGWGAYILDEWVPGESIHLIKNLNYFRADEGLPKFDELTFLIMKDSNAALTALTDGTCDLIDPSVRLDAQVGLLQTMQEEHQAKLLTAQTSTMEWLGIGISPASYDDGYNVSDKKDRPDIFADARTRQAIALCLDRQKVVDTVLFGLSQVPDTYLPSDHPLHNGNVQTYVFNPTSGNQILQQAGWVDHDHNPSTPRQSVGVTNVPNGTPLILNYVTSSATQRRQVVDIFTQSLAQCGIGLNPIYDTAVDLYAPGPEGPLFGRQFDLAEYSIGINSLEPQCGWFTTSQIPTADNHWIGTNISGYKNPTFDSACEQALQSLPDEPEYALHQEAQATFASDLPSIPLYLRLKVAAARPDFCGFSLDPSSSYALAGIEGFDYGDSCKP